MYNDCLGAVFKLLKQMSSPEYYSTFGGKASEQRRPLSRGVKW